MWYQVGESIALARGLPLTRPCAFTSTHIHPQHIVGIRKLDHLNQLTSVVPHIRFTKPELDAIAALKLAKAPKK